MEATSDATKILEKGPEYLRKQMELESETKGHMSAVERLAASKPKYVKSHQVVNSTQEPAIGLGSASVGSAGSSSLKRGGAFIERRDSPKTACGGRSGSPGEVRRSSSRKRPDSLLLYRQKCELLRGPANDRKCHVSRKLLLSSVSKGVPLPEAAERDYRAAGKQETIPTPDGAAKECSSGEAPAQADRRGNGVTEHSSARATVAARDANKSAALLAVPERVRRSGKGVCRSHSDISSRYSKNFADFDAFFKYCGLGGEVIESLGRENFSARSDEIAINVRSVSVSTSEGSFDRYSGGSDGLLEDKLHEKVRQGTSVIERNARIIKWLYSCKNSMEAGKRLRDLD